MKGERAQQIGFRVDERLDALIKAASTAGSGGGRATTALLRNAVMRGLELVAGEDELVVSDIAATAGSAQYRVQLGTAELTKLDQLRARVKGSEGRPVPRVFVLRECLARAFTRRDAERR